MQPTTLVIFFFGGYAVTQLARRAHQERTQVVYSNKGSPEAPGSKTLQQWTSNLEAYAHTCKQMKEK